MGAAPLTPASAAMALFRLVHPFPSFVVALLTAALVPIATGEASFALAAQLGVGMLLFQFAIGAANDIADVELDRAQKPWKPLARGAVSSRDARTLAAACAGFGLLITSALDLGPWLIGVGGLACGLVYDLSLKRTPFAFVPFCIAVPLIPVWVWAAADEWDPLLWWALPAGFFLGFAIYLVNQAPGAAREREAGVEGLAQILGQRASVLLGVAAFGLAASVAALALAFGGEPGRALLIALTALVAMLLAPRSVRFFGRDGLFGVVTASAAIVALVYLSAV